MPTIKEGQIMSVTCPHLLFFVGKLYLQEIKLHTETDAMLLH
jgi:hypothetical protein